jgi:phosphate acetyltransferase
MQEPWNGDLLGSLIEDCRSRQPISLAVCWPCSGVSLTGAVEAAKSGLICPVFVGKGTELHAIAETLGITLGSYPLIDVEDEERAAEQSVELCRVGHTAALMKGSLHTNLLMHAVLKEDGLRTSHRMSHVFVMEAPLYHRRALFITDAVINIHPSLVDKIGIVQNAIYLAHALGIPQPNVAILSAIETVSPAITSTLDAAVLCKMADRGQIEGAILDGPLAFDTAVSVDAALAKNLRSRVAGEADVLVVPDIEAGNMLAKELEYLGGARLAGIVIGATVPIILTSRADSVDSRVASCAIASQLIHLQSRAATFPRKREMPLNH